MSKKCPPGVICVESMTMSCIIIIIIILCFYLYKLNGTNTVFVEQKYNSIVSTVPTVPTVPTIYNNDILLNPYTPPLRNDYLVNNSNVRGGIPINIPTQGTGTEYRQVGILTDGNDTILPLMGRPLIASRDTWNFYCMNDKNNAIKLPISNRGKSCMKEHGCDNLYDGDTVYIEGYNKVFKVTLYDNDLHRYIPL